MSSAIELVLNSLANGLEMMANRDVKKGLLEISNAILSAVKIPLPSSAKEMTATFPEKCGETSCP